MAASWSTSSNSREPYYNFTFLQPSDISKPCLFLFDRSTFYACVECCSVHVDRFCNGSTTLSWRLCRLHQEQEDLLPGGKGKTTNGQDHWDEQWSQKDGDEGNEPRTLCDRGLLNAVRREVYNRTMHKNEDDSNPRTTQLWPNEKISYRHSCGCAYSCLSDQKLIKDPFLLQAQDDYIRSQVNKLQNERQEEVEKWRRACTICRIDFEETMMNKNTTIDLFNSTIGRLQDGLWASAEMKSTFTKQCNGEHVNALGWSFPYQVFPGFQATTEMIEKAKRNRERNKHVPGWLPSPPDPTAYISTATTGLSPPICPQTPFWRTVREPSHITPQQQLTDVGTECVCQCQTSQNRTFSHATKGQELILRKDVRVPYRRIKEYTLSMDPSTDPSRLQLAAWMWKETHLLADDAKFSINYVDFSDNERTQWHRQPDKNSSSSNSNSSSSSNLTTNITGTTINTINASSNLNSNFRQNNLITQNEWKAYRQSKLTNCLWEEY